MLLAAAYFVFGSLRGQVSHCRVLVFQESPRQLKSLFLLLQLLEQSFLLVSLGRVWLRLDLFLFTSLVLANSTSGFGIFLSVGLVGFRLLLLLLLFKLRLLLLVHLAQEMKGFVQSVLFVFSLEVLLLIFIDLVVWLLLGLRRLLRRRSGKLFKGRWSCCLGGAFTLSFAFNLESGFLNCFLLAFLKLVLFDLACRCRFRTLVVSNWSSFILIVAFYAFFLIFKDGTWRLLNFLLLLLESLSESIKLGI